MSHSGTPHVASAGFFDPASDGSARQDKIHPHNGCFLLRAEPGQYGLGLQRQACRHMIPPMLNLQRSNQQTLQRTSGNPCLTSRPGRDRARFFRACSCSSLRDHQRHPAPVWLGTSADPPHLHARNRPRVERQRCQLLLYHRLLRWRIEKSRGNVFRSKNSS